MAQRGRLGTATLLDAVIRPAVSIFFLLAVRAVGQQSAVTGVLECRVSDSFGGAVAQVEVTARHRSSGAARSAITNDSGVARLAGLVAGEYSVIAQREGFAKVMIEPVAISVGQTVVQRITMSLASVSERLDVQDRADALETRATNTNVALGGERIEESPAANRNYLNFVLAAPGVASSPRANTARSPAGLRNPGNDSGFVFAGMRGRNNSISIDGVDNRDEATGGNRVAMGLEMVQEFRVAGTQVSAEFGGAAGGLVNMVTRSGENVWHGDFTFFQQHEKLNARNPEAETAHTPLFRRYQPGVSIGGPVRRDRTFFMSALEYAHESSQEWSEAPRQSQLINSTLAALGVPGWQPLVRGLFDAGESDTLASIKGSHLFNAANTVTARFAYSSGNVRRDVQSVDNFTDVSARGSSVTRDSSFVSGWSHVFSPAALSDLRFQASRRSVSLMPNGSGPMFDIPGVASFGSSYRLDQDRAENHFEAVESLQWVRGRHLATVGASVHGVFFDGRLANRYRGIQVFPTLDAFLTGRPDFTMQAFGDPRLNVRTSPLGFWAQDRWQIAPSLSLELGVRWDKQFLPSPFPSANHNVAPRVGLAWHPGANSGWVFRVGTGLFFDRYPLEYLGEALLKDGRRGYETYNGEQVLYRPGPGFTSTYSRKVTAGFERKLDADTTLSLELSDVRGLHLPRIRNAALTLPPQFALEQTSSSRYRGLSASLNRRLKNEFTYLVTYSFGKTEDDASDYDEHPLNPANTRLDWALSRLHQRHRVSLSGVWEIPLDDWKSGGPAWLREALQEITLAPVVSYGTGRPLNQLLTTDMYRTGAYPISARPAGFRRNADLMPRIASVDLRVMKTIPVRENRARVQFGAELFNALNHSNRLRVSGYYTPSYKGVIEVLNPRQVQLMIQFEY